MACRHGLRSGHLLHPRHHLRLLGARSRCPSPYFPENPRPHRRGRPGHGTRVVVLPEVQRGEGAGDWLRVHHALRRVPGLYAGEIRGVSEHHRVIGRGSSDRPVVVLRRCHPELPVRCSPCRTGRPVAGELEHAVANLQVAASRARQPRSDRSHLSALLLGHRQSRGESRAHLDCRLDSDVAGHGGDTRRTRRRDRSEGSLPPTDHWLVCHCGECISRAS